MMLKKMGWARKPRFAKCSEWGVFGIQGVRLMLEVCETARFCEG